ncbi:UNVERIFIED_ORG: AAA family ATPase [Shinella sp. XGS7]|nr:AAA family ATPase [Shinella sp. XGS7]
MTQTSQRSEERDRKNGGALEQTHAIDTGQSSRVTMLLSEIRQYLDASAESELAINVLQILLLSKAPPQGWGALRRSLFNASRADWSFEVRARAYLQAAVELHKHQLFAAPVGFALEAALQEAAVDLDPRLDAQLALIKTYLGSGDELRRIRTEPTPRLQSLTIREQVSKHVRHVCMQTLEAWARPPELQPVAWSLEDLDDALLCLRLLYCELGGGLGRDGYQVSCLADDFEELGCPLWNLLLAEAMKRGARSDTLSLGWNEDAQAKIRLLLMAPRQSDRGVNHASPAVSVEQLVPEGLLHVVCKSPIMPSSDKQDRAEIERHLALQKPLPITPMPSMEVIDTISERLTGEFPWAEAALTPILSDLRGRCSLGLRALAMPPTLLVGLPGCGKSRLARRIAEELAQPILNVQLGGASDIKVLAGTSRGWATGRPSDIATLMASRQHASATVILDELDKTTTSRGEAAISSYLLGLIERETAARYLDVFLKTECDFSHLVWILTANQLSTVPAALKSRLRIVYVPQPGAEDLRVVADLVVADLATQWGVARELLPTVDELSLPWRSLTSMRQVRLIVEQRTLEWAKHLVRH